MSTLVRPSVTAAARRRAILFVCGSSALFSFASALVKALADDVPSIEIAFFRSFVAALAMMPVLLRPGGLGLLRTSHPWGHVGRTVNGFIGMITIYYGYAHLPLELATALSFAMPLVLSLLSMPLLGERVGPVRLAAVLVGFLGVLVMLRPWDGADQALPIVPVAVVLTGVVAWALAMISIRRMGAAGERNLTIVLWFSIGCTLQSGLCAIPFWVWPDAWQLAGLVAVGLISAVAQLLMTQGYRSAESALLAPFEYGAVIYAAALGLAFWGEIPDPWSVVGILILIGAGIVVWRRG